ncbi:RHS repeat-associated core domain-containing protein [Clostridium cibarium]|uniref:RHS repeat-associated core domain-containing protein n=1 Tax=Clostridium cibarium TaxID=2762247 RepID=A0ABR8PVC1_9CLOT|nr:RHS repeat-associated core domain-containing protein [Clostridium cibarium]MBD7912105.1 RHS repeat-associated core domain-containing protein [Clostridium cibarium]
MKRIWKGLMLTSILILLIPNKMVKAETVEEHLNNLVGPQTQYSTGTASATFSNPNNGGKTDSNSSVVDLKSNNTSENVDPKTGRLKLIQTDFVLPGRNGLNLEIKRIYNSDTSNLHEMKSRYENGVWVDYVSSDEKTSSFYENRYNLGIGQRFSFPTIEIKSNSDGSSYMYLHAENGDIYRIINNKGNYSIEGHDAKDLVIKEDKTYSNGQSDGTSKYVSIDKNGKKTYFSEDGRILSIKDRYDNTIKFEYCTDTYVTDDYTRTRRLISKITDTIGRVVNIQYNEDQNYYVSSDSGELQGKFQVIINLPDEKKIIYDKNSVLMSNYSSHSLRERVQRVYGVDGDLRYHFWFEKVNAGFTFENGNKYSAENTYENLVQVDDNKSNRLVRYEYGTYVKKLTDKGSMEHRKVTAVKELSKTGYDDSKSNFLDKFIFDTKNVVKYTYTNDASGYGVAGYNGSDANYLNNTYRYFTEKVDSLGVKTKFTYSGRNQLISTEKVGKDTKETTQYEYGTNKFPSKNIKQTYKVENGKVSSNPVVSVENFTYDDLGNLTSYTDVNGNRDANGNLTDNEHTTYYTYDTNNFNVLKSKIWKTNFGNTAKLENDISTNGSIKQTREYNNGSVKTTDFNYDKYGNIIYKNIHNADNSGNSYIENYEYGVDENKNDTKGAYLTKSYTIVDGKEIAQKYSYDINTSNKISETDANNNRTSYEYDKFNRPTKITYSDNTTKEYTYNDYYSSNRDVDVKDQNGNLVSYIYDSVGNLVQNMENDEVTKEYTYDAHNNKIKETNINGDSIQYTYNSADKLIKKAFFEGDTTEKKSMNLDYNVGVQNKNSIYKYDFGQNAIYTFHGADIPVAKGKKYKYSFDAFISKDADVQTTGNTFIADGEKGFPCSFKYDNTKKGKWQHFEVEAAAADSVARVLLYPSTTAKPATKGYILYRNVQFKESTTDNNLFNTVLNNSDFGVKGNGIFECLSPVYQTIVNDEENNTRILSYDKKNKLIMTEIAPNKPENFINLNVYDYVGNKINETDGNNSAKSYYYDNLNRITTEYDPVGNKTQYNYDAGGKKVSETNANNVTSYYDYDVLGRMIRKKEPSTDSNVKVTRYVYDNVGNLLKEILPKYYDVNKDKPQSVNNMIGNSTTYDSMNRKDTVYDSDNKVVKKFKYDGNGNVIKDVDGKNYNGNIDTSVGTSYEYDFRNKKTKVTDAKGNSAFYTYTSLGDIETEKDAKGNTTTYSYNSDGTLASVKYPNGGSVNYTYNKLEEKIQVQDLMGNITKYEYNPLGKVKKEIDSYGNTIEYNYDKNANVISAKDKRGNVTYNQYDEDNRLINVKHPIDLDSNKAIRYATENYSYDVLGNLITKDISGSDNPNNHRIINYSYYKNNLLDTKKNNSGGSEKNYYDLNNNLIKTEKLLDTNKSSISKFEYDNNNRMKKSIKLVDEADVENAASMENIVNLRDKEYAGKIQMITGFEYDIQGNKIKEISPKAYGYNDSNKENRDNYSTSFVYNELGQLEKVQYKYNGKDVSNEFSYDEVGNQIKSKDEKGNTTSYTYNSMNQVENVIDNLSKKSVYKYDLNGNNTTFTNAKGNSTTFQYDKLNRLVAVINPINQVVVKNVYDANGNKVKVIDGNGYVSGNSDDARYGVTLKYNLANNLVEEINPELQAKVNGSKDSFRYVYDSYGEIIKKIDALGNETNYNYDNLGNLIKVIDAMGNSTSYSYDKNSNKIYMKDGLNRETFYSYGLSGLINNIKDPEGKVVSYRYDLNENLTKETDKNGNDVKYGYDNKNELVSKSVPKTGDSISYSYDELGNRKEMKDSTGVTAYEYDANSQLLNVKKDGNLQLTYTYDEIGNKNSMTDSKAFKTTYTYDKASRLNTVNYAGKTVTYNYDNSGNKKSIVYPGGSTETITYDKDNRLSSILNKTSGGISISKYDYTYYDNGLQRSKKDSLGTTNYEYNKNGAITKVTSPKNIKTYSYDGVNNRVSEVENNIADHSSGYFDNSGKEMKYRNKESKYTYDKNNKLSNVVEQMNDDKNNKLFQKNNIYTYDNNGNQIKEDVSYLEQTATSANTSNSAAKVTTVNKNNSTTINQFDGFNRLKKVDITQGTNKVTTEFNYNGDDLRTKKTTIDSKNNNLSQVTNYLYDGQNVIQESNEKGQLTNRYVMGDNYICKIDGNNKSNYYMYNGHGDVVQTIDESGNVENKYDYDVFGNSTLTEEKSYNPIRYSGEFNDNSTGLYYLRARYYNPKVGRFISEDSYAGEDYDTSRLNRYTYCGNEPVLNVDPSGHNFTGAVGGFLLGAGEATIGTPAMVVGGVLLGVWALYSTVDTITTINNGRSYSGSASSPFELNLDLDWRFSSSTISTYSGSTYSGSSISNLSTTTYGISNTVSGMSDALDGINQGINQSIRGVNQINKALDGMIQALNEMNKALDDMIEALHEISIAFDGIFKEKKIDVNISNFDIAGSAPTHVDIVPTESELGDNITTVPISPPKTMDDYTEILYPNSSSEDSDIITGVPDNPQDILDGLEVLLIPPKSPIPNGIIDDDFYGGRDLVPLIMMTIEGTGNADWIINKGYKPQPGERTLEGFIKNNVSADAEVGLYTKSPGFNNNSKGIGGQFKRIGVDEHAGLSPHVHQPTRNVAPNGNIYGNTGRLTSNGGVTSPTELDVKQLYDYLFNNKYRP